MSDKRIKEILSDNQLAKARHFIPRPRDYCINRILYYLNLIIKFYKKLDKFVLLTMIIICNMII